MKTKLRKEFEKCIIALLIFALVANSASAVNGDGNVFVNGNAAVTSANEFEHWNVEWFNTQPWQFTQFKLPPDQNYLVTSGFYAPEARTYIWDEVQTPIAIKNGDRLKFWQNSIIGDDLYVNKQRFIPMGNNAVDTVGNEDTIDNKTVDTVGNEDTIDNKTLDTVGNKDIIGNKAVENGGTIIGNDAIDDNIPIESTLRLYGYFDEGPGDLNAIDPVTQKKPEQAPYTDPEAPFYPQSKQSPRKDFVSFNPAIMDHNQGWPELIYIDPNNGNNIQRPQEKVFKRMWYEKAWFKDDYNAQANGRWDVIIEDCDILSLNDTCDYEATVPLDDENTINDYLLNGSRIREHNNDPTLGDTYAPAIEQEFAYMALNDIRMPITIKNGSHILIPMAHQTNNSYRGINSFDAANLGIKDAVKVESEKSINMDIDNDGILSSMEKSESIVLVLDNKQLSAGNTLQFFDNVLTLKNIFTDPASIVYDVCDNEGGGSQNCAKDQVLNVGGVAKYQRGMVDNKGPFYVKLVAVDTVNSKAVIEVGRMFGQTPANIGANARWNQKAFIVDEVLYNVVALKTEMINGVEQFKYMVFRQKLPKFEIKLYGKHLKVWKPLEILPELPPFNMPHEIIVDVLAWQDREKIGEKVSAEPLVIKYIRESKERRFIGELKEIYNQTDKEAWVVEWFKTKPYQFTEFVLPFGQKYLVTTGFWAPEAATHIWDGNVSGDEKPVINKGDRLKFWHDASVDSGIFIDNGYLRLYGYFDEGPGDLNVTDPVTQKKPEQAPYTDPEAPFYPQSKQSPRKDFVSFNPAIMDHNQGWPELIYLDPNNSNNIQRPQEKVFKRMWYEKAWFKDDYNAQANGRWDVIIEDCKPLSLNTTCDYVTTVPIDDQKAIHDHLKIDHRIREHNNDPTLGDTYAPAIEQEFAYMTLNDVRMPIKIKNGSHILIPMAHQNTNPYRGINSFDAANLGVKDAVKVESEKSLNMDIDNDGILTSMDTDGSKVSGDESIVLVLDNKQLSVENNLQFFDNILTLKNVFSDPASIVYDVCDNEGGGSQNCAKEQVLNVGGVAKYQRGMVDNKGPFYVKLVAVDTNNNKAVIEVGRMFGQTPANIGANARWNQKAFIVDEVLYNVVALKTEVMNGVEQFKYIVFRQKLPKFEIKLYGKHLKVWIPGEVLPELPPFNMPHEILNDILTDQIIPQNQQDKIGSKIPKDPLEISYILESKEQRFQGQLKEIYSQTVPNVTAEITPNVTAEITPNVTAEIEIKDIAFNPANITIPKGTKVVWTQNDNVPHSVTDDTGIFNSNILNQGDNFSFTFDTVGIFNYHCEVHPDIMKGTVNVTETQEIFIPTNITSTNITSTSINTTTTNTTTNITTTNTTTTTSGCILPNGKNMNLNKDTTIDPGDIAVLLSNWGTKSDPNWDNRSFADLNDDNEVGIGDAVILINNFGTNCVQ